tara:strand:- start:215 stop:1168 length:954 start_codon:yes stop_codon:yes gene_type:complete
MILPVGHSTQYLNDYKDGKIPMGLGLNCDMDQHLVWKDSQLNIVLGHDNVGKTYWIEWYFLALATNHDKTFTLFMDENNAGKVFRDLIQMYVGKPFKEIPYTDLRRAEAMIEHYFKIVDNSKRYEPKELLNIFSETRTDSCLIDPYNALKMNMNYSENYQVLNEFKMHTKETKQTIYINAHPATASGRRTQGTYPKGHDWEGHIMPPVKSDIEGGKPFANKADDFIIIHRLLKHDNLWKYTLFEVDKVKDMDTGGKPTTLNMPMMLDYNFGLGLKVNGKDVIKHQSQPKQKPLEPNTNFYEPKETKSKYTPDPECGF